MLKELVKERLMAAADEIFALFESTITSYEEELCRTREEKERHRQQLEAVCKTQIVLHVEVFDALCRPSSCASSSDAQPGTSVTALQSESDNLQPASQAPRCAQRTPFTVAAMGKMSVPQTEECHRKVTAHIVKRLHPFSEVESPTFRLVKQ
ncbi:uncharacterized protein LOC133645231 isoform X3 [Entelurus aequoreus]|uniref:uncharacterized protein LOC133645231 isoform X3 n=1 Tax=Entelurus aequoreus TaxID=161455 RepID=UPI002B1DA218|nr:uncharacterized protein LOC133645231 isoform X3 [Entelurus aequoreus]